MAISVVNLISTVEQELFEILTLAFSKRLDPVADLPTLKTTSVIDAYNKANVKDWALRYVTSENNLFRWSIYSTATDDGVNTIQPATLPPGVTNGRWLRVTNPSTYGPNMNAPLAGKQTGFCREVRLYQGEGGTEEEQIQIFGQAPSILIQWLSDSPEARSVRPGALYWDNLEFQILCISECLRPSPAAYMGSELVAENARDPGLNTMLGLVRYVLAGIQTFVSGIESIEISRGDIISEDLAERLFVGVTNIIVRTSFAIPDEDLVIPPLIQIEPKWTDDVDVSPFDPMNYIALGYTIQVAPGLTGTPNPGTAFISGAVVSSTPAAFVFSASSDTYRDLQTDGTFIYTTVAPRAKEPPQTSGTLRVGVTTTDATDIIQDKILCSYSVQFFNSMLFQGS